MSTWEIPKGDELTNKPVRHIMYVCQSCEENDPEACGHFDKDEIRVAPSGEWTCESCWEYADHDDPDNVPQWNELPEPPEYKPSQEDAELKRLKEALDKAENGFGGRKYLIERDKIRSRLLAQLADAYGWTHPDSPLVKEAREAGG